MAKKSNKNKYLGYLAIALMVAFGATYIASSFSGKKTTQQKKREKVEIPFTKHGELQVLSASGDTVHSFNIEIANDDYHTELGLMYRSSMDEDNGMIFVFPDVQPRAFWMRNTRIGLDIIYADAQGKIVSIAKYAKPFDETSLPSEAPAKYVLEINDGLADKFGIKAGQKLVWERTK